MAAPIIVASPEGIQLVLPGILGTAGVQSSQVLVGFPDPMCPKCLSIMVMFNLALVNGEWYPNTCERCGCAFLVQAAFNTRLLPPRAN